MTEEIPALRPGDARRALDLKIAGLRWQDIADQVGIDRCALDEIVDAEIVRLYQAGGTINTICRYLHVVPRRVAVACNAAQAERLRGWHEWADALREDLVRHQRGLVARLHPDIAGTTAIDPPKPGDVVLLRHAGRTIFVEIRTCVPIGPDKVMIHGATPGNDAVWFKRQVPLADIRPAPTRRLR
jgi:hypothetical protein